MSGRSPAALAAYRVASTLLTPALPAWIGWRSRQGKEDPTRLRERYGIAARPRPAGELVWVHGASVGETLSLLPVVEALVGRGLKVLVTSGTRTSAALLARRLPPGARHHFAPLDAPRYVTRFLDHWQPRLALFVESELWPNQLVALARRSIPLVVLNGRMSARSFARWTRAPALARALTDRITLCLPQSDGDGRRWAALGAPVGPFTGNLKFDLAPPPADPAAVEALAAQTAGRPIFAAASTHPGEEVLLLDAHLRLRERRPGLLTIVAPRHPERGREIADAAAALGLAATLRSAGPDVSGDVLVVDTIGELGLFYRLAPLVFVGGSLVRHGGQNPIEPARLGAAILHGPHVDNFADVYAALDRDGGARLVADIDALVATAGQLLANPAASRAMARKAAGTVAALGGALDRTLRAIEPYLPPPRPAGEALW